MPARDAELVSWIEREGIRHVSVAASCHLTMGSVRRHQAFRKAPSNAERGTKFGS